MRYVVVALALFGFCFASCTPKEGSGTREKRLNGEKSEDNSEAETEAETPAE